MSEDDIPSKLGNVFDKTLKSGVEQKMQQIREINPLSKFSNFLQNVSPSGCQISFVNYVVPVKILNLGLVEHNVNHDYIGTIHRLEGLTDFK